jgi:hypothetical protein
MRASGSAYQPSMTGFLVAVAGNRRASAMPAAPVRAARVKSRRVRYIARQDTRHLTRISCNTYAKDRLQGDQKLEFQGQTANVTVVADRAK